MAINLNYISVATQHRLLNGLMEYWKLDETSTGDAVGAHAGKNLTNYNNKVTQNVAGLLGRCVQYPYLDTGETLQRTITGDYSMMSFYNQLTMSVWVNLTETASTHGSSYRVFEYGYGQLPYQAQRLLISSTNNLALFSLRNHNLAQYDAYSTGYTIGVGSWYHIVGVCYGDGQNSKIFVNNNAVASVSAFTGSIYKTSLTTYIRLGGPSSDTSSLVGYTDEAGIWNRALTDNEISELYNSGTGITYPFS